ncbi:MAG TPA: hypothetical protein VN763_15675, partial [Saprospiraceae bacterium]|nr:hypothetical protein [Saprospiraceae bacterium]
MDIPIIGFACFIYDNTGNPGLVVPGCCIINSKFTFQPSNFEVAFIFIFLQKVGVLIALLNIKSALLIKPF